MLKFIILIVSLTFSAEVFGIQPNFLYKIKLLKKEESFIGCLGERCKPTCSNNLFIMEHSSLSFRCEDKMDHFTDKYIYIYSSFGSYFVCPEKTYNSSRCHECSECSSKLNQLKSLNTPG